MATTTTNDNIRPFLVSGRQSDQSIWEVAASITGKGGLHPVGTRAVLPDGRVFYYARNSGSAIVAGQLLQTPDQDAQNSDLAVATDVVGSSTITPTLGSTAAVNDEFEGGYAIVNSGTAGEGPGLTLPIISNPAAAGSATIALTPAAPLPLTFNADVTVTLLKSPWADVVIAGANQDHFACGVSNVAVPAGSTNPQYFWCQTWGVCGTWQDAATANGSALASGTTAGRVEIRGADGDQCVGMLFEAGVDGDYSPTFLTISQ